MVGIVGIEPTTSHLSGECSNQSELYPYKMVSMVGFEPTMEDSKSPALPLGYMLIYVMVGVIRIELMTSCV